MTTETRESKRKNPDYSGSAVNLCNPIELKTMLVDLQQYKAKQMELQAKLSQVKLYQELRELEGELETLLQQINQVVDEKGSFQDAESYLYAVKQRRISLNYDPQAFRENYPQYAPAVIKETVDTTRLNGLIKGGLLDTGELLSKGVATESESYAYIVKV